MKSFIKIVLSAVYCSIVCNFLILGIAELISLLHSIGMVWSIFLFLVVTSFCWVGQLVAGVVLFPLMFLMKGCKAAHYYPMFAIVICGLYSLALPWIFGVSGFGVWYWIMHIFLTFDIFNLFLGFLACVGNSYEFSRQVDNIYNKV